MQPYNPGVEYHSDYLGVHQPVYERVARGERDGWSAPDEVAAMLAQLERALATPGVPQGGRLLELGCGDGCLTVELAKRPEYSVAGIDIVLLALELAQRRAAAAGRQLDLRCGSICTLPWPDAYFDIVVDGHCLHCIVLDDRPRALAEVRRVLRPGGALVVMTMCGNPPPGLPGHFEAELRLQIHDGVAGRHIGTPAGLLSELRAAGFAVLHSRVVPRHAANSNDELVAVGARPYS
jgi:ubiquinone/menaquinone biosynthesis C-methylase UbiE